MPFQRKTALSWSSPPLSSCICGHFFLTLYPPSYPTFTKFHFAGFPAYVSPCLFSLLYNSNVVVAFVLVFTASQVPIHFLPCLHCTQYWISSTHLSRPTLAQRPSGNQTHVLHSCYDLPVQYGVKEAFSWFLYCRFFFSDLHFWQLVVNSFTKNTFSCLFSTLSEN